MYFHIFYIDVTSNQCVNRGVTFGLGMRQKCHVLRPCGPTEIFCSPCLALSLLPVVFQY